MMRHIVSHLATVDDTQFERLKTMCVSIGEVIVRPLAEALTAEQRARLARPSHLHSDCVRVASGRHEVERLKNSPNAAVRRTAIYLLREFGGSDALPELTELLNDNEQQVQREAVRAILRIGTEPAYQVLERALVSGTVQSREMIMQALTLVRDERATPLFWYILHPRRSPWPARLDLYASDRSARDAQGPGGGPRLKAALYPRRMVGAEADGGSAHGCGAGAGAHRRAGSRGGARGGGASGSRGIRTAARAQLASARVARPAQPRQSS